MEDKIIAKLERSYSSGRKIAKISGFRRVWCYDVIDSDYVSVAYEDGGAEEFELDTDWSTFLADAYGF